MSQARGVDTCSDDRLADTSSVDVSIDGGSSFFAASDSVSTSTRESKVLIEARLLRERKKELRE